jgi:hypothetical protein
VVEDSILWLKLDLAVANTLHTGDYIIDVVGTLDDGSHESLLDPEPVRITNRPTFP